MATSGSGILRRLEDTKHQILIRDLKGNNPHVKSLDLSDIKDKEKLLEIINALQGNKFIEEINLGTALNDPDVRAAFKAISKNFLTLKSLIINNEGLDSKDLCEIVKALPLRARIANITILNANFSDDTTTALKDILSLRTISLRGSIFDYRKNGPYSSSKVYEPDVTAKAKNMYSLVSMAAESSDRIKLMMPIEDTKQSVKSMQLFITIAGEISDTKRVLQYLQAAIGVNDAEEKVAFESQQSFSRQGSVVSNGSALSGATGLSDRSRKQLSLDKGELGAKLMQFLGYQPSEIKDIVTELFEYFSLANSINQVKSGTYNPFGAAKKARDLDDKQLLKYIELFDPKKIESATEQTLTDIHQYLTDWIGHKDFMAEDKKETSVRFAIPKIIERLEVLKAAMNPAPLARPSQ